MQLKQKCLSIYKICPGYIIMTIYLHNLNYFTMLSTNPHTWAIPFLMNSSCHFFLTCLEPAMVHLGFLAVSSASYVQNQQHC